MRLRHIEVFYHVYKEGTVSAAARNLFVSQPSVSKVLRHAEDQLGFALFERKKGRLHPTEAANELFLEVSDIYERVAALNRTSINIRNRKGGHLRIGVLPSLGFAIAPSMVASMRASNPDASFDLATLHTQDMPAALIERRFDLCIGFDDETDDRIRCRTINAIAPALVAPPGAYGSSGKTVDPVLLDGVEMIGLRDSGPVADRLEDYLARAKVAPHTVVTAQTYYIAAELVKLGVGVAIVDGFTARRFEGDGLVAYPLEGAPLLPFVAMTLAETDDSPLVTASLEALKTLFN